MRRTFGLCVIVGLAAYGPITWAQSQPAAPLEESGRNIEYASVATALAALRNKPGVRVTIQDGWILADDSQDVALWSFAPINHPSYPSAVKRRMVKTESGIDLEMTVRCEATKAPCDDLVRSFQQLNKQMIREIRGEN